jgi:hypothetical protein
MTLMHIKLVPAWVFEACLAFRAGFMDVLLWGDGTYYAKTRKSFISTVSPSLAWSSRWLLASIGIQATLSTCKMADQVRNGVGCNHDPWFVSWAANKAHSVADDEADQIGYWVETNESVKSRRVVCALEVEGDDSVVTTGDVLA